MITSSILYLFNSVFSFLISLLPEAVLPIEISNAFNFVLSHYLNFATLFPFLNTLLIIISLGMTIELTYVTYRGITYIMNLIRGAGN